LSLPDGVTLGVTLLVGVTVGVTTGVALSVDVTLGVTVTLSLPVGVTLGVTVTLSLPDGVTLGVTLLVGVTLGVTLAEVVGLVGVSAAVTAGDAVVVGEAVGVSCRFLPERPAGATENSVMARSGKPGVGELVGVGLDVGLGVSVSVGVAAASLMAAKAVKCDVLAVTNPGRLTDDVPMPTVLQLWLAGSNQYTAGVWGPAYASVTSGCRVNGGGVPPLAFVAVRLTTAPSSC
jgi:hypothetical protein